MSRSEVVPVFPIKDINISNLQSIQIIDVSADLYCGRRFQVLYIDQETELPIISKAVRFSKLVKKIHKLSKEEENLDNLKAIKAFLGQLKQVEIEAKNAYKHRGCFYRFFTAIQRAFHSGSHLKKIDRLSTDVQEKINQQDVANVDFEARMAVVRTGTDYKENERAILLLIDDCISAGQLAEALSATGYLLDYKKSDDKFLLIANAYMQNDNLEKAAYAVERISSRKEEKVEIILSLVDKLLSEENPNLEAALRLISFIPSNESNEGIIYSLTARVSGLQTEV